MIRLHAIEITPSSWHEGMLSWTCPCGTSSSDSFGEIGRAVGSAVRHVPGDDGWTIHPHPDLPAAAVR